MATPTLHGQKNGQQTHEKPTHLLRNLWQRRELLQLLAWRDILSRYRGAFGGALWAVLTPLLMLSVYTAVFSGIFQARWGSSTDPLEYALQLFVGLTIHGLAGECLIRAPNLLVANSSYVKKVVFPLELLPVSSLLAALFNFTISVGVLVVFYTIVKGALPWGALWLPVVIFPYVLFLAGISWLLSLLGAFMRDVMHVMGLVVTLLMFLSPVFYPASMLPPKLQTLFMLNPLTIIIEQSRAVLLDGQSPDLGLLAIYALVAGVFMYASYACFMWLRKGVADVL